MNAWNHHVAPRRSRWVGLLALVVALLVLSQAGCEKQRFYFVVDVSKDLVYEIDQTGAFDLTERVTSSDIRSALDIPEDAEITDVQVKSLVCKVYPYDDNSAPALLVTGRVDDQTGPLDKVFENETIPLAGVDVPYIGLNALISGGISKIRNRIKDYVDRTNNADFLINLQGNSQPADWRIHVALVLVIDITVKYSECLDVPAGFTDGESCD